ncbi:RNA-directed DNA polymerase, eukaryota [Tanacetum coccineum]
MPLGPLRNVSLHPSVSFKSKLQRFKSNIKIWCQKVEEKERSASLALRNKIDTLDTKAEVSFLTDSETIPRNTYVKSLTDHEHYNIMDLKQKAKIRWALEGDENSRFFHGMINNRRNRSRINGLNIHGEWVSDPVSLKKHIFQYFDKRFKEVNRARPSFTRNLFKQLSNDEVRFLDYPFTILEIKDAVWDCGCEKAPGPDGFTFKFFKNHWDTLENDVVSFVKNFENSFYIPKGCNSSFIILVPKLEDPLVIGDFRPISLIGCQYKIMAKVLANQLSKVFDSLSWFFLLSIIEQIGFSSKWRKWIHSYVNSAFASIIINGSPIKEFKLKRGLRQGDPLSPFLFIIAAEALNVAILEATNNNIFHGIKVGKDKLGTSHQKVLISKWKANTLSFGGRLTLIKSVLGSLGVYYFSTFKAPKKVIHKLKGIRRRFFWGGNSDVGKITWVAWDKVVSPQNKGGLGIGSLVASNNSLLTKWWWRFRNEGTSLWCNVIHSIHGPTGGVSNSNSHKKASGTWSRIINLKHELTKVGINLPKVFKKKIGDGRSTSFWHDHWLGDTNLQE